ncbi:cdc25-like protein phosphatase twine-related [Anaeramoeba flamelloides]|uniref:protein-tyrosine-phosphatase n=1 Tax=Anaeramoeba flamelloides TaxID=1746091 RepID=A0AAV7ZMP9_9EUKA|nr:cdc25-like protein phosphatase twine-related [Anaeramoeba flamelloides]
MDCSKQTNVNTTPKKSSLQKKQSYTPTPLRNSEFNSETGFVRPKSVGKTKELGGFHDEKKTAPSYYNKIQEIVLNENNNQKEEESDLFHLDLNKLPQLVGTSGVLTQNIDNLENVFQPCPLSNNSPNNNEQSNSTKSTSTKEKTLITLGSISELSIDGQVNLKKYKNNSSQLANTFLDFQFSKIPPRKKRKKPLINKNKNKLKRSLSDVNFSTFDPSIDEKQKPILDLIKSKHTDLNIISLNTLCELLSGEYKEKYNHEFNKIFLIDCRFDWEFEAGHIKSAKNWNVPNTLFENLFGSSIQENVCVVFYCEFSQSRGPKLMRLLRDADRQINKYPKLHYPQSYLLAGGYRNFFENIEKTRKYCGKGYRQMKEEPKPKQTQKEFKKRNAIINRYKGTKIKKLKDLQNWFSTYDYKKEEMKKKEKARRRFSHSQPLQQYIHKKKKKGKKSKRKAKGCRGRKEKRRRNKKMEMETVRGWGMCTEEGGSKSCVGKIHLSQDSLKKETNKNFNIQILGSKENQIRSLTQPKLRVSLQDKFESENNPNCNFVDNSQKKLTYSLSSSQSLNSLNLK